MQLGFYGILVPSPRLRFVGLPVSLVASLPPASSDGTNLSLERSTSKMTSGSVAARASAWVQTPRGVSKGEGGFGTPNVPFPASSHQRTWSFLQYLVGPIQVHNHQRENDKLVFLRNPASSKGMAEVAFIDAMSRPNSIDVNINVGGELGSMTLEPGIYTFTISAIGITKFHCLILAFCSWME
jgi:hypothetical protein